MSIPPRVLTAQEAAERTVAELREDAERYRWLRNHPVFLGWEHDFMPHEIDREIDKAIAEDAALAQQEPAGEPERPKIVCLCGSTRFKPAFDEANYQETMAGRIVLSVGFYMHASGNRHGDDVGCTDEQKIALDVLHKRKIDLADEVLVLNVGGYIGESTRSEINYAIAHGKPVRYLESTAEAAAGQGTVAQSWLSTSDSNESDAGRPGEPAPTVPEGMPEEPYPHCPAAFINAIADEGTKEEAVDWLQKTWDECCALRQAAARLQVERNAALRQVESERATLHNVRLCAESAERTVAELRTEVYEALDSLWAAIGDRLLAKGPLDKAYAHNVLRKIDAAKLRARP